MRLDNFYIYIYLDPRKPGKYVYGMYVFDYEPFYVGKGKDKQYISHLREAVKKISESRKDKKLRRLL
jgi:hypothetical protein